MPRTHRRTTPRTEVRRNPIEIGVYLLAFLLYKACIAGLALACWVWLLDIIKGG